MQSFFSAFDAIWGKLTHRPVTPIFGLLTETGEVGGNPDILGDYSITPVDFYVQPPTGVNYLITSATIFVDMAQTPVGEDYGTIDGGLTNGIDVYQRHHGDMLHLNEPMGPITDNKGLAIFGAGIEVINFTGAYNVCGLVYEIVKAYGQPMVLFGNSADRLIVRASDNFTTLNIHKVAFYGMRQGIAKDKLL